MRHRGDFGRGLALSALAISIAGCSSYFDPGKIPDPVFPVHHDTASWSSQGLIAYRDNGIIAVGPEGLFSVDPSLVGIWVVDLDSREAELLLPGGRTPAWSPDGDRLAFSIEQQIYTAEAGGMEQTQLTFEQENYYPGWSPEGGHIAWDQLTGDASGVWRMTSSGEDQAFLVAHGSYPDWHPGGGILLCNTWVDSSHGIFEYDLVTGGLSPVRVTTSTDFYDVSPRYSPDGAEITFARLDPGKEVQVWVMNSDGSAPRELTSNGGSHPGWSPDGSQIVYTREDWYSNDPEDGVLWVIDVETGEEYQLTFRWYTQGE